MDNRFCPLCATGDEYLLLVTVEQNLVGIAAVMRLLAIHMTCHRVKTSRYPQNRKYISYHTAMSHSHNQRAQKLDKFNILRTLPWQQPILEAKSSFWAY